MLTTCLLPYYQPMTTQSRRRLSDLYIQNWIKLSPAWKDRMEAIPPMKYKTTTANGLTRAIIDFLNFSGHQAERINTMGVFVREKAHVKGGYYRPTTGTKGSADVSATINGKSVKIEIKVGADRLSLHQKAYRDKIEAAGGVYLVARTFDDFLEWYDKFIAT